MFVFDIPHLVPLSPGSSGADRHPLSSPLPPFGGKGEGMGVSALQPPGEGIEQSDLPLLPLREGQ